MTYRYCAECDQWYATHEYDVAEDGETVCPEHDRAVVGSIQPHRHLETDVRLPRGHEVKAKAAARRQNILETV